MVKDRPEKERFWVKYGVREARLKLITRWAKRASRHYEATQPHKQKLRRLVSYTCKTVYLFVVVSSRLMLSGLAQNIMMNLATYHSKAGDIALSVENGQGKCAGVAAKI